jgi:hypothetical protein
MRRRLGLEGFQGAQRAPQLGERAAAIAQQRVEGAGIVAIANQGETEAVTGEHVLGEQLGLEALGARQAPARGDDPLREHGLERACGGELLEQLRLEGFEGGGALARQHDAFLSAKTMLQRVLRRSCLALGGLRAAGPGAVDAARRGARGAQERRQGDRVDGGRAGRARNCWHGRAARGVGTDHDRDSLLTGQAATGRRRGGARAPGTGSRSLPDTRNNVQHGAARRRCRRRSHTAIAMIR